MLKKLAMTAFALLGVAGVAAADPIDLPAGSPLVIDFENIEQLNVGAIGASCISVPGTADYGCSDNWGFLRINTISYTPILDPNTDLGNVGTTGIYSTTTNGATEIYGIFYGINLESCVGTSCTASGGVLDLYWHESGIAGVSTVADLDPDTTSVDAVDSGTFLVRLVFDNGILANDNTTTLTSTVNLLTDFGEGTGNGFLSVDTSVVGLWTSVLNGDWFFVDDAADADTIRGNDPANELRDLKFRNTFTRILAASAANAWNTCAAGTTGATCVGLDSSDPAEVFTLGQVPEPATLSLLGIGLAGLGYRRRKKAA